MTSVYLLIPLLPLISAVIVGLFNRSIPKIYAHWLTTLSVGASFVLSVIVFLYVLQNGAYNGDIYTWLSSGDFKISVGFLIDRLSALMMLVVTFVSLMVHIYTIGYMQEDDGYRRFFSYISLFTFSMLMLVMSNNFMQLFFGWEAVGLVSYLLIGFWMNKPSAIYANLKAFLVNRIGDFGFLLGIGLIYAYFNTLDYQAFFQQLPQLSQIHISLFSGTQWLLVTVIALLLFIGAMGKSAQVPLHVWLPDSMEGPTPISALIHAATMVTAGIFMVARMSPLYELSDTALSAIMIIGAITALFMGFLGIIQNDIKRVVAYSTLSQLGYMTTALGASAYSVAIFHLMTHAFFKALLFLSAGSVIMGMHHDQDIRNMGGLRRYMKITWITALIGTLALVGTPFFSGFYSKDLIIEAVHFSHLVGSQFAYFAVSLGVFVTAFYSFRMYFLVFHGQSRWKTSHAHHNNHTDDSEYHGLTPDQSPHESPWVITIPLVLLAIPSVIMGYLAIGPVLNGFFQQAIVQNHPSTMQLTEHFHSAFSFAMHSLISLPFMLALSGFMTAWLFYVKFPTIPAQIQRSTHLIYLILKYNYGFDRFNALVFAKGSVKLGQFLWRSCDVKFIDDTLVNGTARFWDRLSKTLRLIQSGMIYHYAFAMIVGIFAFLTFFLARG